MAIIGNLIFLGWIMMVISWGRTLTDIPVQIDEE